MYGLAKNAQAPIFLRLTSLHVKHLWTNKQQLDRMLEIDFHVMWICAKEFSQITPQTCLANLRRESGLTDDFVVEIRVGGRPRHKQQPTPPCGKPTGEEQV